VEASDEKELDVVKKELIGRLKAKSKGKNGG